MSLFFLFCHNAWAADFSQSSSPPSNPSAACALQMIKADVGLSKFEVATVCKASTKPEDTLKCIKEAKDDDLALTKMWISQLCSRDGSPERIRCFREAIGNAVGMNRQEALELCRP